jgi:flagellar basal body-associated protein FliL
MSSGTGSKETVQPEKKTDSVMIMAVSIVVPVVVVGIIGAAFFVFKRRGRNQASASSGQG